MTSTTTRDAGRRGRTVRFAAMLAAMAVGHAARGGEPWEPVALRDSVVLAPRTNLHVGRQVLDTGPLLRQFSIERIQRGWAWVVDHDLKGWIRLEHLPLWLPWVGQRVALKSLETRLRIGRKALDTRRNGQDFTVKQVQGDWLWLVGDDDLGGWVRKRDVISRSDAIAYFTGLVESDPRSSRARYLRGLARDIMEKAEDAIADFDEAIRLDPRFAAAYRARAVTVARSRSEADRTRAIVDLTEAIRLDPGDAEAHYQRGAVYRLTGEFDRAIADLTEAIRLEPNMVRYWERAMCWKEKKDYARAVADYDEAFRRMTSDELDSYLSPLFYFDRGWARDKQEDWDRAIADYSEVIRRDSWPIPTLKAAALNNRGLIWLEKNQEARALADFNRVIGEPAAPGGEADLTRAALTRSAGPVDDLIVAGCRLNRSRIWRDRDDKDRALADCQAAIELKPDLAFAYLVRGSVQNSFAGYEQALADYREAIRLEPKSARGHSSLAWLRATCPEAKFRDGKEAVEAATRACELTQWKYASCLVDLAAAEAEAGDFDAAVRWQLKALEILRREDVDEARALLELYRRKTPYRVLPKDRKSRSARLGLPDLRMTAG